ncbi:MAG: ABC transporter ATP-binding protein [Tissierellia bacterium]|nr:ABC transporter ATP-binding protein [Tissierellia bacterium]
MFKLYKKLFSYVPERLPFAYLSMVLAGISVFVFMGSYWYLWKVFYSLLMNQNIKEASSYGFIIVLFMIVRSSILITGVMASHYLGFRLETNLRIKGFYHLMDASFSFFDKNSSGSVRKTIDDNAGNTHKTVAHLIPDTVTAILTPILMFIMIFIIDFRLGILLVITTMIGIFQYKAMYSSPELMEKFTKALEDMSSATVEYIRGMQVIKVFGITVQYYKELIQAIFEYRRYVYEYSQSCRIPYVSFQVLFNIYYGVAVPFAILFISKGEPKTLILTKIIFFAVFSGVIFGSFMSIMFTAMDHFQARQAVEKLERTMEEMEEEKLSHGKVKNFNHYSIEFNDVSFQYEDQYVLEHFNLLLKEGKTYAFVGPSGGGKSTIAKLISGFYPVEHGEIRIGDRNIRDYDENTLLKNIAFVFQGEKLFSTTIYDNVQIGNPNAPREKVMEALKAAQCEDILEKFPQRELTIIGSKGVHLSGGEIQRIAIARAILKDSRIIILDEASGATDPENEYECQLAFSQLMKGKTVIMIAHRLSSLRNVDEILFVEDGKIMERGNHRELIEKNGRYAKLQDLYQRANVWRVL